MTEILERKLSRANEKIAALESMLEDKTRDLFEINADLKDANTFMGQVLRSMAGALIVTDADKRITMVNDRLSGFLGYREEDIVGQPVRNLLPEAGTFASGPSMIAEQETHCVATSGEQIPVTLTTSRIQVDEHSDITGYVYIAIDIRERRAAEAKLAEVQQQMLTASRQAGMAEVATGVLHNVGNVLNSVNVSGNLVNDRIRQLRVGSVRKLAELMAGQGDALGSFVTDDPKGRQVPDFLMKVSEHLEQERDQLGDEVRSLLKNIEHIRTIVSSQQSYARLGGANEVLKVDDIILNAVEMYRASFSQADIRVKCEFAETPALNMDRHKVMQIVINFLSNARHALLDSNQNVKRIDVTTHTTDSCLIVGVADNGIGIPHDNLNKIFNHGFTTKENGHGFGLHSCANAATELGGSVRCRNNRDCGATFELEIPLGEKEIAA